MAEIKSFKERVKEAAIQYSKDYKDIFVDYEYLICSDAFTKKDYYIIDAHKDNYLHLIGISTAKSQNDFFECCYNGSLQESDFSFTRPNETEKAVKGTVRRKIKALQGISNIFSSDAQVQEDFRKNRISCSFAAGNTVCTLGFTITGKTKPMTLLSGNELDLAKSKPIKLILKKSTGTDKFDSIVVGDKSILKEYLPAIKELISEELIDD